MKVLVTGVNGQLGYDVCKKLNELNIENCGIDIADCDLTSKAQTIAFIEAYHPTDVIHCAAYTAVDRAQSNAELCFSVNAEGTHNVAVACKQVNATMLYISTDYVFNGSGDAPVEVDEPISPLNIYGQSKYMGELAVRNTLSKYFIIRTSWIFGINGKNFVKTMLRLGKEKKQIEVVCDQIGSPTYSADLAQLLCNMIQTEQYGVYHATNEGFCSWYEFAKEIMRVAMLPCEVIPVTTSDYGSTTERPMNSRLSKAKLDQKGFARLPDWHIALANYIDLLNTK